MKLRMIGIRLLLAAGTITGLGAEVIDQRNVQVPGEGIDTVRFKVAAGFLDIEGSATGTINIDAEFDVRTRRSVAEVLRQLEFRHEVRGRTLIVETRTDLDWGRNENARINLTVQLPASLNLEIADGSGWLRVADVDGHMDIKDGSGDITLARIGGDLVLNDGSGQIDIRGAAGSVQIRDGSGGITAEDVGRGLEIRDGSGEIEIQGVGGDVTLRDSSGGIRVVDVEGNFEVLSDSTGGIRYDNVRGQVDVPQRRRRNRPDH